MIRKKYDKICHKWILTAITLAVLISCCFVQHAFAASGSSQSTSISGPWDIIVKMGFEGEGLILPLKISDQNKSEKLNIMLPVPETTLKVKLEEYIPDLVWETTAVKYAGDGIAAQLKIKGKDLEQDVWLGSANPAKQSITSSVGGVAIKKLYNTTTLENNVKALTSSKAVGVLSVWPKDSNVPIEYAVKVNDEISIPQSKYKLTILQYIPHYSIEAAANKVVNLSDEPINPAIKIAFNDGENNTEQWIWSKFQSSPHQENKFPLRIQFADFDAGRVEGRYFLVVAPGTTPWLIFPEKGKKKVEKAVIGCSYLFTNEDYSFDIEKIIDGAIVETKWKNNSEQLINPALITVIEQDGASHEIVLELNKPLHYQTDFGTLVLLYRHSPE